MDEVLKALAIGIPSSVLGYLVWRQGKHVDTVSEKSGIATGEREGIGQVVDGLMKLIDSLQEDNSNFRDEARLWAERAKIWDDRFTQKEIALERCRAEVDRLREKYE